MYSMPWDDKVPLATHIMWTRMPWFINTSSWEEFSTQSCGLTCWIRWPDASTMQRRRPLICVSCMMQAWPEPDCAFESARRQKPNTDKSSNIVWFQMSQRMMDVRSDWVLSWNGWLRFCKEAARNNEHRTSCDPRPWLRCINLWWKEWNLHTCLGSRAQLTFQSACMPMELEEAASKKQLPVTPSLTCSKSFWACKTWTTQFQQQWLDVARCHPIAPRRFIWSRMSVEKQIHYP